MIKYLLLIFIITLLSSCGIYKYEYQSENRIIVSKKNNSIDLVYIYVVENLEGRRKMFDTRKLVAKSKIRDEKYSKTFSLEDFSLEYFKCIEGCSFYFEKEKTYWITILPKGDRNQPPIIIEITENWN